MNNLNLKKKKTLFISLNFQNKIFQQLIFILKIFIVYFEFTFNLFYSYVSYTLDIQ